MRTLLASHEDSASLNLRDALLDKVDWETVGEFDGLPVREGAGVRMVEIPGIHLDADFVDQRLADAGFPADEGVVFLSKHAAASGRPALTVHPIGNWRTADYGGHPNRLTATMPRFMARCIRAMDVRAREAGLKHDVTYEATHHGPTLGVPACFLEIGTVEKHWTDPALGSVLADALLDALREPDTEPAGPVLLGIAGSHYAARLTDHARLGRAAFGHVLPAYHLKEPLDPQVILQAVEGTPGIDGYYLSDRAKGDGLDDVLQALGGLELGRFTDEDLANAG